MGFFKKNNNEISANKKEKPKKIFIYKAMSFSGWRPYEAYLNVNQMIQCGFLDSYENINKESIRSFKADNAKKLLHQEEYRAPQGAELLTEEEFYSWYYNKEQLSAIEDLKKGVLTYDTLSRFMKIDLPEGLDMEEDILSKIKTNVYSLNKGDVYIMLPSKYATSEVLKRMEPSLVICLAAQREMVEEAGVPYVVRSYLKAFAGDLSSIWHDARDVKTIGISGSVGKTTTTEMIGLVTGDAGNMYKIEGNKNTEKQVLKIVFNLKQEHEIYVQEAAGSFSGQLELSTRAMTPDIFVITNVGMGHIGSYGGNRDLLMWEKLALDRHAAKDAVGIVNIDNDLLGKISYEHQVRKISMHNEEADYHAECILEKDGEIHFDVVEKDGVRTKVTLNMCGDHNIYNAMSAFAVGVELGIEREKIVASLAKFRTDDVRQNYVRYGGRRLFLDCYSITADSIKSALLAMRNLTPAEGGRRIFVLGDMRFMGDTAEEMHRETGKWIAEADVADEVFFYGTDQKFGYEEAVKSGAKCRYTDEFEVVDRWVREETTEDDVVCFKGSHMSAFQWIIDNICGTDYYFYDELCNAYPVVEKEGIRYKLVDKYGAGIHFVKESGKDVVIPEDIDGYSVRITGKGAFRDKNELESLTLPNSVLGISARCFRNDTNLKSVTFGKNLLYVGVQSFEQCKRIEELDFSNTNLATIDRGAFQGCTSLRKVILPESTKFIDANAFDNDSSMEILCKEGSYAEMRARELNINCRTI